MQTSYSDNPLTTYASFAREQEVKRQAKIIKRNKAKINWIKRQEFFEQDLKYVGYELDNELDNITATWDV